MSALPLPTALRTDFLAFHVCSLLPDRCLEWWHRGSISFVPKFLRPASLDLACITHVECLSQLEEGATASTFHNKYLFKQPGVQARFLFPRRLLTDDLKNCFPVTDRVIHYHGLLYSLPPAGWGELWLQVPQAASHRGIYSGTTCYPLPPQAAGWEPGSQVHLGAASGGCIS